MLINDLLPWHSKCNQCRYESADLTPLINSLSAHLLIKEADREVGLRDLRRLNFQTLIEQIKAAKPMGGRLLDVGCAHGWFLEMARDSFEAMGIEPDDNIAAMASNKGLTIRRGYFPDALIGSEMFDVIVFNDLSATSDRKIS